MLARILRIKTQGLSHKIYSRLFEHLHINSFNR